MPLEPKHIIAECFMRRDAFMPSKETLEKAEQAIAYLEENGWRIVKAGEFMRVTPDTSEAHGAILNAVHG